MTSLECRKQTMKCLEQGAYINYLQISKQALKQLDSEVLECPSELYLYINPHFAYCFYHINMLCFITAKQFSRHEITVNHPTGLDDMIRLAGSCIEFLQETLEHYGEALNVYDRMMCEMNETFWRLYGVDMESVLAAQESGSPDIMPLFHRLNSYLYEEPELRYGKFHMYLHQVFVGGVV